MQYLPKKGETNDRSKSGEADSCREADKELPEESRKPKRSYYYDDAHGYQDYEPDDGEEPKVEEESGDL